MAIYRDVSDWKSKASALLEALREIAADGDRYSRQRARLAIEAFQN